MAKKKSEKKKEPAPRAVDELNQQDKYCPNVRPKQAKKYLKLGHTVKTCCDLMGISYRTWMRWKKERPEFRLAVIDGEREFATEKAERKLMDRCMGYDYTETHTSIEKQEGFDKDGEPIMNKKFKQNTREMHAPPDVAALRTFLAARLPEKYGNKADSATGGKQLIRDDIIELTPAQRQERLIEMINNLRQVAQTS